MRKKPSQKNKIKIDDSKPSIKRFTIPIYERVLKVIVCEDTKTGLETIGYKEFDVEEDWIEATVVEDPKGTINVIIKPDATINTICHESFHVVTTVLGNAGMELCDKSEEAYAYLIGWVAERIEKSMMLYNT